MSRAGLKLLDEIRINDITGRTQRVKLLNSLGTQSEGSERNRSVLERLLEYAATTLKASTAVVEPYISTDWADEYQTFYSRILRDVPRMTKRVHFLRRLTIPNSVLSKEEVVNLNEIIDSSRGRYLGYTVVRPFQTGGSRGPAVGETILAFPDQRPSERVSGKPLDSYKSIFPIHPKPANCQARFRSHVMGYEVAVYGFPFIQQDQNVSVCAEADLWMIARYMNQLGQVRRYRPSEMEDAAKKTFRMGLTREGLDTHQMYDALREMGLNPDYVVPANALDALSLIESYTASGIPLIASVGEVSENSEAGPGAAAGPDDSVTFPDHVVTALGCRYQPVNQEPPRFHEQKGDPSLAAFTSSSVSEVIVHNDSRAPYQTLATSERPKTATDQVNRLKLGDWVVYDFFVPTPPRVNLRVDDVRQIALVWRDTVMSEALPPDFRWPASSLKDLRLRTFLVEGFRVKREALRLGDWAGRQDPTGKGKPWGVEFYWRSRLPRYVWIVELSRKESAALEKPGSHRIVGEILLDSTSHFSDFINAVLGVRLDGRLLYRDHRRRNQGRAAADEAWDCDPVDRRGWSVAEGLFDGPYPPYVG